MDTTDNKHRTFNPKGNLPPFNNTKPTVQQIRDEVGKVTVDNFRTDTPEGKLLWAALVMLTTSPEIQFLGKTINGRQTTPWGMLDHLKAVAELYGSDHEK
jgi:hypothetical protein